MLENTKMILNAIVPGVKAKEYSVDDSYRHKGFGREFDGSILVYDQKSLVAKEGPYQSQFDLGLNIGRKRFLGRLEWATGILMSWGGGFSTGVALASMNEQDWFPKLVFSLTGVALGVSMAMDGKIRKDVATSIINKMSQRQSSSISESKASSK